MTKKQKKNLIRIAITTVMLIILWFIPWNESTLSEAIKFVLYMATYLVIGYDILISAAKGIKNRQPFDECLLMAIATVGAVLLAIYNNISGSGESDYVEAVAVMLFYQIGEWFQSYAIGRSRKSITDLMDICPDYANIENDAGELEKVDPDEVEIGTIIVVQPGEKIPLDGVVTEGETSIDTAALTGESVPRTARAGDEVISGCINLTGVIKVRTTKEFGESTASKVLELIEDASSRKSKSENFITRFSRIYTPTVCILALLLFALLPIGGMIFKLDITWGDSLYRALTFLVISCPCALVISIPLTFFAGIGCAGSHGILVKGSNYLEILSNTRTVVFDKTGTLTEGVFEVTDVYAVDGNKDELLHISAHAEKYSNHPIAQSVKRAYKISDECEVTDAREVTGRGVMARVAGKEIAIGNGKLMNEVGAKYEESSKQGTILHVASDGEYKGYHVISDVVKKNSRAAIEALKKSGVTKTVMLTGDRKAVADAVGKELGIDEIRSELLPQDKVAGVEELLSNKKNEKDVVAFVGDGINDAPVLSRADIGIAMGAMGSDAAIEAADVVLMDDDPLKISEAIRISRKCLRIVKENIWFAIGIKIICLLLGALGIANMWLAIFADVGVMVIAVLNAIRCMFIKK